MGKVKVEEVEAAVAELTAKIDRVARAMQRRTGRLLTRAEVIRLVLGVHTLNTEDLSAAEVAAECHISEWTVAEAAREYLRTGGKSGLGPFRMYGRQRRFPRASVDAWKASRTVAPSEGRAA